MKKSAAIFVASVLLSVTASAAASGADSDPPQLSKKIDPQMLDALKKLPSDGGGVLKLGTGITPFGKTPIAVKLGNGTMLQIDYANSAIRLPDGRTITFGRTGTQTETTVVPGCPPKK